VAPEAAGRHLGQRQRRRRQWVRGGGRQSAKGAGGGVLRRADRGLDPPAPERLVGTLPADLSMMLPQEAVQPPRIIADHREQRVSLFLRQFSGFP